MTPDNTRDIDRDRLAAVCDRYRIARLSVFGSVAGAAGEDRDVDPSMSSVPESGSDGKSTISPTSCRRSSGNRWIWWLVSPCTRCSSRPFSEKRDRSMQRDILLLSEMVDAAEQAQRLVAGLSAAEVGVDRMRRDSLLWNFTVLGEAATLVRVRPRHASRTIPGATALQQDT